MSVRATLADMKSARSACAAPSQSANPSGVGKAEMYNPDELVLLCSLAFCVETRTDESSLPSRSRQVPFWPHNHGGLFRGGNIPLPPSGYCRRQHLHRRRTGQLALCGILTCIDPTFSCLFFLPLPSTHFLYNHNR
jgi:hypothetical protein